MDEHETRAFNDLRGQVSRLTAERDAERARVAPLNKSAEQAVAEVIAKRTELRQATVRAEQAEKDKKWAHERIASLEAQVREMRGCVERMGVRTPISPVKMLPNDGNSIGARTWGKVAAMQEEAIARAAAGHMAAIARGMEAQRVPSVVVPDTRRHNSTCPRCKGEAFVGLFSFECLRVGGCVPASERKPGIGVIKAALGHPDEISHGYKVEGLPGVYALEEDAVAAWRLLVAGKARP